MNRRMQDIGKFAAIVLILILINIIGSAKFFRIDLTQEKRYSLSPATIDMLEELDERVFFKVYLDGEFPADFQRLQRETRQMLDEFRAYSSFVEYDFVNPNLSEDNKTKREIWEELRYKGLEAIQIQEEAEGGQKQVQIFPGAIASYAERETPVKLLIAQFATAPSQQINNSIEKLEFTLANSIRKLISVDKPRVGFVTGNGELEAKFVADIGRELSQHYVVDRVNIKEFNTDSVNPQPSIGRQLRRLNTYDALIIAKPTKPFNDLDKYLLDQYIMHGGKTLWFIDAVHAEMDSLSKKPQFLAYPTANEMGLTDWLFRYGVRVNTNVVQDMVSGGVNDRQGVHRWIYFPLIMPQVEHPITNDLNAVKLDFASTVDTIIAKGIKKTFLLRTSPYSRTQNTPHMVNLRTLYEEPVESQFKQKNLPVAVLLEGEFFSVYKNRIIPKQGSGEELTVKGKSSPTQILVVGDGDIIKNQLNVVNPNIPRGTPLPLGYDQYTGMQYGNKDFILNTIDYMLDESDLISIRSRELTLRLLDHNKVNDEGTFWKMLNTALPIVLVILFGILYAILRKRKYSK